MVKTERNKVNISSAFTPAKDFVKTRSELAVSSEFKNTSQSK